jgi:hypothetical protein
VKCEEKKEIWILKKELITVERKIVLSKGFERVLLAIVL